MCFQPLSPICLRPVGVFPEHWAVLALVFGFEDLRAPTSLFLNSFFYSIASIVFHSSLPSFLPKFFFWYSLSLVFSLSLYFHPSLPTPREESPNYMTSLRSYIGTSANTIIVIYTFSQTEKKKIQSRSLRTGKVLPILGYEWVSAVVATIKGSCCVVSSNKCLNICDLFIFDPDWCHIGCCCTWKACIAKGDKGSAILKDWTSTPRNVMTWPRVAQRNPDVFMNLWSAFWKPET